MVLLDVLKIVAMRVESLQAALTRIKDKIATPYAKIVTRTTQLARLQSACELLRHTLRYLYLSRRLRGQQAGGTREVTKVASCLLERRVTHLMAVCPLVRLLIH